MIDRRHWILGIVIGALLVAAAPVAAAGSRFFHSPSGNIQCEVDVPHKGASDAYCQTFSPPRSVILHANGKTKACHGGPGCVGNGPENAFTLRYAHKLRFGPYRCASYRTGVRCIVVSSGHGFAISRQFLKRFERPDAG